MNTAIAVKEPFVIGRRRFGTLIVGVAVASASITGVVVASFGDSTSDPGRSTATNVAPEQSLAERWRTQSADYVDGVAAMSQEELAGAFGNLMPERSLAERWRAQSADYVDGVAAMSQEELAGVFGHAPGG